MRPSHLNLMGNGKPTPKLICLFPLAQAQSSQRRQIWLYSSKRFLQEK